MELKIRNVAATIDDKAIAFPTLELIIEGEQYPVRLKIFDERDKKKVNRYLKSKGFQIGEVSAVEAVSPLVMTLRKGE